MMSVCFSANGIDLTRLAIHFMIIHALLTGSGIGLPRLARHFWMCYICYVYLIMELAVPESYLLFVGNEIGLSRLAIQFCIMHVLRTGNGIGLPRLARHLWM